MDLLLPRGPGASAAAGASAIAGASVVGAADSAWRGMEVLLSYKVPAAEGLKEALPPGTQGHLRAAFPAPPQPTRGLLLPPPSWLLRRQRVAKGGARDRRSAGSYGSPGSLTTSNPKLHSTLRMAGLLCALDLGTELCSFLGACVSGLVMCAGPSESGREWVEG